MKRILVVEDNDAFRGMLTHLLAQMGYATDEAATAWESVAKHDVAPADVIIINLLRPETDAIEAVQAYRRKFPPVKIFTVSACGRISPAEFQALSASLGADRTFTKPVLPSDVSALRVALKDVLGESSSPRNAQCTPKAAEQKDHPCRKLDPHRNTLP